MTALARLDRDVELFGSSSRAFPVPEGVELSDERLAALQEAWAEEGLPPPTVAASAPDIEIDVPPGAVIQTAQGGICTDGGPDWPFDAEAVAAVIQSNIETLENLGVRHLPRTEVMILDSGLPHALAEHAQFSRFLHVNLAARLVPGKYVRNKELSPTVCTQTERRPWPHRHGYVTEAGIVGECLDASEMDQIVPPRPNLGIENYVWDHGGFVGVLAAGGPDLMAAAPDLDRFVGVSFARVMREENDTLRADGTDVSSAIEFAQSRNVPVLNLSLRVSELHENTIADQIDQYWDATDGLVVAAAGNTGGELVDPQNGSTMTFPASVAERATDNLIIVGGIEQGPAGTRILWPDSSRSARIVDIAAPANGIRSLDGNAEPACFLGTSVAAPQVSFAAAVLRATGMNKTSTVKRRILATADRVDAIEGNVRDGRVLNTVHALDVFTDLIWRRGESKPERVEILPPPGARGFPIVRLCSDGAESQGWIDLTRLHLFERRENGSALLWRSTNVPGQISDREHTCTIMEDATIRVRRVGGSESDGEPVSISDIDRIVPTHFRSVFLID